MKNKLTSISSLLMALVSSAFTNINLKRANCTDNLVWFQLAIGENYNCSDFTSIKPSDLIALPRSSSNPIADMAGYIMNLSNRITTFPGCPPVSIKVCSVGYEALKNNFSANTINGQSVWLPKYEFAPVCKTCRVTIP